MPIVPAIVLGALSLSAVVLVEARARDPHAQSGTPQLALSEKQKRAVLAPLIREASDCFAAAVVRDPRFADAVRQDRLDKLIGDAVDPCWGPLSAVVNAHDRLYGAGTGRAFAIGPYLSDLPRALEKRLKDRIALAKGVASVPDGTYLVLASREDVGAAVVVAQGYAEQFRSVFVARAANGRYAIVVGPVRADVAVGVRDKLKAQGLVPQDTFVSDGQRLISVEWRPSMGTVAAAPAAPTVPASPPTSKPDSKPEVWTGSGFFVADDGTLLTNEHVVEDCATITVRPYGRAYLVRKDAANDLAVIKISSGAPQTVATFKEEPARIGSNVLLLGYPLSDVLGNALNVTAGMVSSLSGIDGDTRYFQFSAPLQPGNSGGPVLDNTGRVVGVATAKLNDETMLKVAGTVPQNVNFALGNGAALAFLRAAGVPVKVSSEGFDLTTEDVAEAGGKFTVQVVCER